MECPTVSLAWLLSGPGEQYCECTGLALSLTEVPVHFGFYILGQFTHNYCTKSVLWPVIEAGDKIDKNRWISLLSLWSIDSCLNLWLSVFLLLRIASTFLEALECRVWINWRGPVIGCLYTSLLQPEEGP